MSFHDDIISDHIKVNFKFKVGTFIYLKNMHKYTVYSFNTSVSATFSTEHISIRLVGEIQRDKTKEFPTRVNVVICLRALQPC